MKISVGIIAVLLFLSGCAGLSESAQRSVGVGTVESDKSSFDGATEITMQPAFVAPAEGGQAKLKLGFNWRSTQPEYVGVLVRITSLTGYNAITGAALNLNGTIIQLEPAETFTQHESTALTNTTCNINTGCTAGLTVNESDKLFIARLSVIESIPNATSAKLKVSGGRNYDVGDLLADSYGNVDVRDSLPDFISKIEAEK